MATTSLIIKHRPFSIEPNTGIMMPDGIFDTAIFEQNITCFFTNIGLTDLKDVSIYFEGVSDPNINVNPKTYEFPIIPAGASIQIFWLGDFKSASPGKKNISLIAKAKGFDLKREIKQIFVTKTTYNAPTNTYICEVPEGSLRVKFKSVITEKDKCRYDNGKGFPPIWLPVELEMGVTPNPPYSGQFGDLPFQDPWWKVVALIVAAVAAIGAAIASALGNGKASVGVGGKFDETTGKVDCCKPSDGLSVEERLTVAGALSSIATGAIVVACSDEKDPWYRGQEATLPKEGEITIAENVTATLTYIEPPSAGKPYPIEVEWTYIRVTDKNTYSYHVKEIQVNTHVVKSLEVKAPETLRAFKDPFVFHACFQKEDEAFFIGNELVVFALIISPTKVAFKVPLFDDGINYDEKPNDGIFTGYLDWHTVINEYQREQALTANIRGWEIEDIMWGYWRIYIYAQDINDALPSMKPTEAATHIGGAFIVSSSELTFDSTLPCPLTANATVNVIP